MALGIKNMLFLNQLKEGDTFEIVDLTMKDQDKFSALIACGIHQGKIMYVVKKYKDGSFIVIVDDMKVVIGSEIVLGIGVKRLE